MTDSSGLIPLSECRNRYIYKIKSRNLAVGVFTKDESGFTGIREKFGILYLFTEYHYDTGPPYGTVRPEEDIGPLPEEIEVRETVDGGCGKCGAPCVYHSEIYDRMVANGWPKVKDASENPWVCEKGCPDAFGTVRNYGPLYDYLRGIELALGTFPDMEEIREHQESFRKSSEVWKPKESNPPS